MWCFVVVFLFGPSNVVRIGVGFGDNDKKNGDFRRVNVQRGVDEW